MTETFTVQADSAKNRIDKALASMQDKWSRTQVQNFVDEGHLLVNGEKVKKTYKVKENDIITVDEPEAEPLEILAEELNLELIYEDEDVLVVNKPKGMVVHPA